ncbi:MAG: DNA repair protein RecN [Clostridia bacterium]|nr:DNA repair protein RecN [Clostridia bacterium]
MLLSLHIENIAIIDKSDIDFCDGFNVLTGETGAGKSIIIDSIALLTGVKSSKELIGSYGSAAIVSAVFTDLTDGQKEGLSQLGITPDDDGNVIIFRRIAGDGRNLTKINGTAVTVTALKEAAVLLVSIHGQHDGTKILEPQSHISYLDEYCGIEPQLEEYRSRYESVKKLRNRLDRLTEIKNQRDELEAALKFKIGELENANINVGEYEKLKSIRTSAQNSAVISKALYLTDSILTQDENCISDGVSSAVGELERIKDIFPSVSKPLEILKNVKAQIEDAALAVSELVLEHEESEYSPEYIENRLYTIENIMRKYSSEANAADMLKKYKAELDLLADNEFELEAAASEYKQSLSELEKYAQTLSRLRSDGAKKLSENICAQLKELDMPNVKFEVSITRNRNTRGGNKYTVNGYDSVEFLIAANIGLKPRPISKIASGGELSRIMLCLKSTLNSKKTDCSTVIYDEIDSGVSGSTAQKIGYKLKNFSKDKQVFCITHLAQIAAMADHHYKVWKRTEGSNTRSDIRLLSEQERRTEVARIMGGIDITDQLLKSADELIKSTK